MSNLKNRKITIYVTEEEFSKISAAMEKTSIPNLSEYIRKMVLNGYVINLDISPVRDAVTQLKRIFSSVNKIAETADTAREKDIKDIMIMQEDIWGLMNQILVKLASL